MRESHLFLTLGSCLTSSSDLDVDQIVTSICDYLFCLPPPFDAKLFIFFSTLPPVSVQCIQYIFVVVEGIILPFGRRRENCHCERTGMPTAVHPSHQYQPLSPPKPSTISPSSAGAFSLSTFPNHFCSLSPL